METQTQELSLREILNIAKEWLRFFLSKWWLIVLVPVVGGLIGYYIYSKSERTYKATLTYALEDGRAAGGASRTILGLDFGNAGGAFSFENLNELFKSRRMVEETLMQSVEYGGKKMTLAEIYIQDKKWRENLPENSPLHKIHFRVGTDPSDFSRAHDSLMSVMYSKLMKDNLSVGFKGEDLAISRIEVEDTNDFFAQQFAISLTKTVTDFYVETRRRKAQENLSILVRQVDSIRGQVSGAIASVAATNDNTFALNPAMTSRRAPAQRKQVDVQTNSSILTELTRQSELAKIAVRQDTPLIQIIDVPKLPLPASRMNKNYAVAIGGGAGLVLILVILSLTKLIRDNL